MYYEDRMWFHFLKTGTLSDNSTIRKLSTISEFKLWHHWMGHMNAQTLCKMHKFARGIPKLIEPDFYKCQTCAFTKIRNDVTTQSKASLPIPPPTPTERIHPGQHLGYTVATKNIYL